MALTTQRAKRLRRLYGVVGIVVLVGGTLSCNIATTTDYVCIGSALRCAVTSTPGWATALGWASVLIGPVLILFALTTHSPDETRKQAADVQAYIQRGRDAIRAARERDGGACQECGATDGTDVVYRSTAVPPVTDPARYDIDRMIVVCKVHRSGLPLARGVLNVPIGD